MAYASRAGRARVSTRSPQAFAVCDRCGIWNNHVNLRWQYDWAGAKLNNLRILVCDRCEDIPQQQKRAIVLTADPLPVLNARVEPYAADETNYFVTDTGSNITTEGGVNITPQQVGPPLGNESAGIMPLQGTVHFDVLLPVASITSIGTNVITVTCSAPHGLSTNDQVAITGTSIPQVQGFYSVTVTTATAFTYEILPFISSGSYLTETTLVATCSVGLPIGYEKLPIIAVATNIATTPYQWVNNAGQPIYWSGGGGSPITWSFP
jgi:hypothetical protein